jgi:hypothetical protein
VFPTAASRADLHPRSSVERMKSRSESSLRDSPVMGRRRRTVAFSARWMVRPNHSRGASVLNRSAPAPDEQHEHSRAQVGGGCEPVVDRRATHDGRDRQHGQGQGRRDLQSGRCRQGCGRLPTTQPGLFQHHHRERRRRPRNDPSDRVPRQLRACDREPPLRANAILLTSHRQTELATSNRSTRAPNRESTRSSERHDEKTESRLGNNR